MRELAGHRNPQALAKAIKNAGYPTGFTYSAIRTWEDDKVSIPPEKLEVIASVCEIPEDFFYADFAQIAKISAPPQERIRARLSDATARAEKRRRGKPASRRGRKKGDQAS